MSNATVNRSPFYSQTIGINHIQNVVAITRKCLRSIEVSPPSPSNTICDSREWPYKKKSFVQYTPVCYICNRPRIAEGLVACRDALRPQAQTLSIINLDYASLRWVLSWILEISHINVLIVESCLDSKIA